MVGGSTRASARANRNRALPSSKSTRAFGEATERILALLRADPTHPYNPTTVARLCRLPLNRATAILTRLTDSGRICRVAHGTYAARDATRPLARRKLGASEPFLHNLVLLLPLSKRSVLLPHPPPPLGGQGGERRSHSRSREVVQRDTFHPLPKIKVTLLRYPDKLMATVGASDDPLSARDVLWLLEALRTRTGYDWVERGVVVKRDENLDLRYSLSGVREAVVELHDLCLAVYQRGGWTRVELRNRHDALPIRELVDYLRSTLEPPHRPAPAAPLPRTEEEAMFR